MVFGGQTLVKRCEFCGRDFTVDRRAGDKQKACGQPECRKERKRRAQKSWREKNPGYFDNHYEDYVKEWRQRRREARPGPPKVIKDEIPLSKPYQQWVLLIPGDKKDVIKDEIRLRRVDNSTFAAYGP